MDLTLQNRIERSSTPEPNSGCWLWDGSISSDGYGTTSVNGRRMGAHRASYVAHKGEIPHGMVVRHKCDTKSCINPDHLLIGTHSDNSADSVSRHPAKYRNVSKIDLKTRIEQRSVPEPNSGCWLWDGAVMALGYGELLVEGKKTLSHRAAYAAFIGEIPKGALVLHKCSTRLCVNPEHLELGTHKEKIRAHTHYNIPKTTKPAMETLGDRIERLSTPEPNTGCYLWAGTVVKSTGYGEIKVAGRKMSAHCASWISQRGAIPSGMIIMHKCDVRSCVNIDHLSVGTRKDNSIDMTRKGRGSFNRFTSEQRKAHMKLAAQTMGPEGLSARAVLRVSRTTPEQRSASARKNWTPDRRAKASARKPSLEGRVAISYAKKAYWAGLTAEERTAQAKLRASNISFEQHSSRSRNMWASMTPEARAEHRRKVSEGRLRASTEKVSRLVRINFFRKP